jgi:hypothetical protein
MSKRADLGRRIGSAGLSRTPETLETAPLAGETPELDAAVEIALPREHPRWSRDRFTVSAATKALIDRLRPLALRVFGFWDHRVHNIALDDAVIGVDICGSYRCE